MRAWLGEDGLVGGGLADCLRPVTEVSQGHDREVFLTFVVEELGVIVDGVGIYLVYCCWKRCCLACCSPQTTEDHVPYRMVICVEHLDGRSKLMEMDGTYCLFIAIKGGIR